MNTHKKNLIYSLSDILADISLRVKDENISRYFISSSFDVLDIARNSDVYSSIFYLEHVERLLILSLKTHLLKEDLVRSILNNIVDIIHELKKDKEIKDRESINIDINKEEKISFKDINFSSINKNSSIIKDFGDGVKLDKDNEIEKKKEFSPIKNIIDNKISELNIDNNIESDLNKEYDNKEGIDDPDIITNEESLEDLSSPKAILRQSTIFKFIKEGGDLGRGFKEVLDEFSTVSERTLRYDMEKLLDQNIIERLGNGGPGTAYVVK